MPKERLVEIAAEQKLGASPHSLHRSVSCRYSNGVLRLDGRVPSFYLKQLAQALLQGVDGVRRVDNALVVVNAYGVSSEPTRASA